MAAADYKLTIEQGVDFELPLTFSSGGSAMNLLGYLFRIQIKDQDDQIIYEATSSTPRLLLNTSNSTVTIQITSTESSLFNFELANYSLDMISPANKVTRIIKGDVILLKI